MPVPRQDLTVLASGCAVSGHVAGGDLDVLGRFEGELYLSGRMHVARGSQVKGRVRASLVEIDGDFEGEVRAETLRVGVGGSARGKFFAGRLSIVDGACLEGDVNPSEPALDAADGPSAEPAVLA
jgi:cytoskeletal protein CcmA (bactofilin family)